MLNPYEILGLNPEGKNVTRDEIKKAYRKRALVLHPDKHPIDAVNKIELEKEFNILTDAYNYLLGNGDKKTSEENSKEVLSRELIDLILKWPVEDQELASPFVSDPDVIENMRVLISESVINFDLFIKPIDPLLWELFSNKHYVSNINKHDVRGHLPERNLVELLDLYHEEITFNRVELFKLAGYETGGPELPVPNTWLTEKERFWLYVAAEVGSAVRLVDHHIKFLYLHKRDLIKKYLPDYIKSKGMKNAHMIANILNVFGCCFRNQAGRYMCVVHEAFIMPLEEKARLLNLKNDSTSDCKAAQIKEVIKIVEKEFATVIESFLSKNKDRRADANDIREHISDMHCMLVSSIKRFSKDDIINHRRNLIGDILRATLGLFIIIVAAGFPLLSNKFLNTFFYTNTKVKLREGQAILDKNMPLIRDVTRPYTEVMW